MIVVFVFIAKGVVMGKRLEVCLGEFYGRLTLEEELPIRSRGSGGTERWFRCLCECGQRTEVPLKRLRSGKTRSCGCLVVPPAASTRVRDPLFVRSEDHPDYGIYRGIKKRCYSESDKAFPDYGGRGICMCSGWKASFKAFSNDMGPRPSKEHSIDRIENNGNYSCGHCSECIEKSWPMNCRWATRDVQRRNQGDVVMLTFQGETLCMSDMARKHGLSKGTLRARLERGMSLKMALTTPVRQWKDDRKFLLVPAEERDWEWKRDHARRLARNGT